MIKIKLKTKNCVLITGNPCSYCEYDEYVMLTALFILCSLFSKDLVWMV